MYGQLGHGDTRDRLLFVEIQGIPRNISQVICLSNGAFIFLTNGMLLSCGYNLHGNLAHGDRKHRHMFEEIKGIARNISEIACNDRTTFIRLTNGKILSCGNNEYGQLSLGDTMSRTSFEEVPGTYFK